jgi:3-dehydroquinate dehydratase/shikimate dehydrogenase
VDAVQCCHEHDPVAKSIGAINTIIRRPDGKLVGYNTDYIGAISAIEDGIGGPGSKDAAISPLAGRLVVVVGAGGAGKAIAYGAKEKGARVVVANRTYEKAVSLAAAVGGHALRLAELETFRPEEGMILANATSLGMYPNVDGTPIPKKALSFYDVVFDAVYAPKVTRLLREAEECGIKVVSGVEMFVRQAMGQFEHFTGGIEAPESLMREIAAKYT